MPDFSLPSEFDLSDHFDHATLMRAIGLKPEHALLSQHEDSERLHTRLRGSGTEIYEQTISFFIDPRTGLHLRGLCTCPVGFNCKHVAAALMAHEAGLARARRLGSTDFEGAAVDDLAIASFASAGLPSLARASRPEAAEDARAVLGSNALPHALETWLGSLEGASAGREAGDRAMTSGLASAAPTKRLMYVLCSAEARLMLKLHLGSARRSGEISRHHPHAPSVADMLRTKPSYVGSADEALLAALLPLDRKSVV